VPRFVVPVRDPDDARIELWATKAISIRLGNLSSGSRPLPAPFCFELGFATRSARGGSWVPRSDAYHEGISPAACGRIGGTPVVPQPKYEGQGARPEFDLTPCPFLAPRDGFEPSTQRLTAACSTTELPGIRAGPERERGIIPLEAGSGIEPLYTDLQSERAPFSGDPETAIRSLFQTISSPIPAYPLPCRPGFFPASLHRNCTCPHQQPRARQAVI
jgi:hypothetical protein